MLKALAVRSKVQITGLTEEKYRAMNGQLGTVMHKARTPGEDGRPKYYVRLHKMFMDPGTQRERTRFILQEENLKVVDTPVWLINTFFQVQFLVQHFKF